MWQGHPTQPAGYPSPRWDPIAKSIPTPTKYYNMPTEKATCENCGKDDFLWDRYHNKVLCRLCLVRTNDMENRLGSNYATCSSGG